MIQKTIATFEESVEAILKAAAAIPPDVLDGVIVWACVLSTMVVWGSA